MLSITKLHALAGRLPDGVYGPAVLRAAAVPGLDSPPSLVVSALVLHAGKPAVQREVFDFALLADPEGEGKRRNARAQTPRDWQTVAALSAARLAQLLTAAGVPPDATFDTPEALAAALDGREVAGFRVQGGYVREWR